MSKYFGKQFHVSWNEINAIGQVSLSSYFQYVVETAWAWGAANGLGMKESETLGLGWVIHETELNLFRPLLAGDDFELSIWLLDWRRIRGTRCFELHHRPSGELIANGVQEIVVLDSRTLRPVAPPQPLIDNLRIDNPRVIPRYPFPKPLVSGKDAFVTERVVEWRDLDWQEHVNNSIYPAYADEAGLQALANLHWSPAEHKAAGYAVTNRRVHIQYLSPASWGEKLKLTTTLSELRQTGGTWQVEMEKGPDYEPAARCVLEWVTVDRDSGEETALPQALFGLLKNRVIQAGESS